MAGGPFGALGSIAFWIATEVLATVVRLIMIKCFGERFTRLFGGESETIELMKTIYNYFAMKIQSGMNASLQWMMKYIELENGNMQKKLN